MRPGPRRKSGRGRRRAVGTGLALVLALGVAPGLDAASLLWRDSQGCRVWMVVDGDTVRAFCPGKGAVTARLTGFDTPEMNGRCIGETLRAVAASYALRWELWTARETRTWDGAGQDRYGRTLLRLDIDGTGAASRLIGLGLARPYDGGRRAGWCGEAA